MSWFKRLFSNPAKTPAPMPERVSAPDLDPTPDLPHPFGYKTAWFALRTTDTAAIAAAFGLSDSAPTNWASGMQTLYATKWNDPQQAIFIAPPLDGWTLVVTGLQFAMDAPDTTARVETLLAALSTGFGEAQYFGSYRVADYIGWARATNGQVTRAFAFVGSEGAFTANLGVTTDAEQALGMTDITGIAPADLVEHHWNPETEDGMPPVWANETAPSLIAADWSINPQTLPRDHDSPATGLIGYISRG